MIDPILAVFIEELPNIIARMDIEARAISCQMDDNQRVYFLTRVFKEMRETVEHTVIYGDQA